MSTGPSTRSPLRRTWQGLLVSLVTLVLCTALAEGAYRLILLGRGEPYDAAATRSIIRGLLDETAGDLPGLASEPAGNEGARDAEQGSENVAEPGAAPRRYSLHPYTGYHLEGNEEVVRRSLEYLATPEGREAYTILVHGGSVAMIFASESMQGHERLEERLEASGRFGDEVEVLPFGCAAHKQPQQLEMVAYLLSQGAQPDMVLCLDGYNEIIIPPNNIANAQPLGYPALSYWMHLTGARELDQRGLDLLVAVRARQGEARVAAERALTGPRLRSALLGRVALGRVRRAHAAWSKSQVAYVDHRAASRRSGQQRARPLDDEETSYSLGLEQCIDVWYESSLLIQALCKERGIRYVDALQPALATGSKTPTPEERQVGMRSEKRDQRVAEGYEMIRERAGALRAAGAEFYDLTEVYAGIEETIFIDEVHVNKQGNRILADALADALLGER